MIWLTWRQHRIEILILGLVVLLFAAVLLATGVPIIAEAQQVGATTCVSQQHACLLAQATVANDIDHLIQSQAFNLVCIILPFILPVLAGLFIGAPAMAREFEQGTYRMIWTQGMPWSRWFFSKIGLITCVVLCAFAILFGLFSWWSISVLNMPIIKQGNNGAFNTFFDNWGIVTIAYALFALMLGIFMSMAARKTVPAMAITLVVFVTVRILIVNFWRPYYLPPVVANANIQIPASSWIISDETVDRQGQVVTIDATQTCNILLYQSSTGQTQYDRCMRDHGFQTKIVYQPADRYWLFQGIESGIYFLFAAILLAMTFWWTKYRIIGK